MSAPAPDAGLSRAALQRYYRLHAGVYDATRWSFLFGRQHLIELIAGVAAPRRILEVGCGTGRNIEALLRRFPEAHVTGVDLSAAMLEKAGARLRPHSGRLRLIQASYDHPLHQPGAGFDLVLCSYSLSMFNPGWERAIACAALDLEPGGLMALVDFHDSPAPAFRRWMGMNHVRMEGQLQPALRRTFPPVIDRVRAAYAGLWRYHLFVGRKP
ncbi:MAG: ubiquinone/menaquinone biosynthesis methyltransferase [Verrucomicrobiaceae bacterium]|nr:ubiquinone/menaquinone biosynthesis methyltransferase [Verrucomicrobiaceae bacterium]